MDNRDEPTRVSATEARAGTTPRMTRPILAMSLALVIVAFIAVWYFV